MRYYARISAILAMATFGAALFVVLAVPIAQAQLVEFPYIATISHNSRSEFNCRWPQDAAKCICPGGSVVCGGRTDTIGDSNETDTSSMMNKLYCCNLTQEAKDAGITLGPAGGYNIDTGSGGHGSPVMCDGGAFQTNRNTPIDALVGVNKWAKDRQLDFGTCQQLNGHRFAMNRLINPGKIRDTDFMCHADEIACGGQYANGKNDSWNGLYCCKFDLSRIVVRAFRDEAPNADLALPFGLTRPADTLQGTTKHENNFAKPGLYTLSVTEETASSFPGYECTLYTDKDPTEVPCVTNTVTGQLVTGGAMEMYIKFKKPPLDCKNCSNVIDGGAQCGQYANECEPCIPGDPDPENQRGCLDCGTCSGSGATCNAEGKCALPFDAACRVLPKTANPGEPIAFSVNAQNATEPVSCVWASALASIDGRTECDFTQAITEPGNHQATVTISDGSLPPRTTVALCSVSIFAPMPSGEPPSGYIPDFSLCEAYKVLIAYGIPLFAIMGILAGFQVLVSLGDPRRIQLGKAALLASVVGMAMIFLAKPILGVLLQVLGFTVILCGSPFPA